MAEQPKSSRDQPRTREVVERALFEKAITPRRAARLIAAATLFLTACGGVAVWLFDKKDFKALGDSLWWAMQTVTTVGYGDIVPKHTIGRIIGSVLMLNGIALLSVVTAAVTARLIEQARQLGGSSDEEVIATLQRMEARLDAMEAASRPGGSGER